MDFEKINQSKEESEVMSRANSLTMDMILLSSKIMAKITRDLENYEIKLADIDEKDKESFRQLIDDFKKQGFDVEKRNNVVIFKVNEQLKNLGETPEDKWN